MLNSKILVTTLAGLLISTVVAAESAFAIPQINLHECAAKTPKQCERDFDLCMRAQRTVEEACLDEAGDTYDCDAGDPADCDEGDADCEAKILAESEKCEAEILAKREKCEVAANEDVFQCQLDRELCYLPISGDDSNEPKKERNRCPVPASTDSLI